MQKFAHKQRVAITSGAHAGKTAFFDKYNGHRAGFAFVWFAGPNMRGAQIKVDYLEPEK